MVRAVNDHYDGDGGGYSLKAAMPDPISRRYRVEFHVTSSLCAHGGEPFRFAVKDIEVVLRLPTRDAGSEGFVAEATVSAASLPNAEREAHDAMARLVDVLAFEFKMPMIVDRIIRSFVEESGKLRHCAIYSTEKRRRPLFMMKHQADEVQRVLASATPDDVDDALHWLRWSYLAERAPEAFVFGWMAVERLVGEEDREARCQQCGQPVVCLTHGQHSYRGVRSASLKAFLENHGVKKPNRLLDLRHPLVHGSLKTIFEKRLAMTLAVPEIWRVGEEELRERLGTHEDLEMPIRSRSRSSTMNVNCEYRTESPDEPFPSDCPTYDDVKRYQQFLMAGQNHDRITQLLEWPPSW